MKLLIQKWKLGCWVFWRIFVFCRGSRNHRGVLSFSACLAVVLWGGCSSTGGPPAYRNLCLDRTVAKELQFLESLQVRSIRFDDVTLSRASFVLSSTGGEPGLEDFHNRAVVMDPVLGSRKVSFELKDVSLAQVYDALCEATDSVWWVDGYVVIERKLSEDEENAMEGDSSGASTGNVTGIP